MDVSRETPDVTTKPTCYDLTNILVQKRDSIHHHLLETFVETANVLELKHQLLYATPCGW